MAEARIVSPNEQRRRYQVGPPATLAGHPHSQPSTRRLHRNALRELHSLPLATPATPPERNIGTLRTEPRNALFIGEGAPCVEPREPLALNCGTTFSLSLSFHLRRTSETFFFSSVARRTSEILLFSSVGKRTPEPLIPLRQERLFARLAPSPRTNSWAATAASSVLRSFLRHNKLRRPSIFASISPPGSPNNHPSSSLNIFKGLPQ